MIYVNTLPKTICVWEQGRGDEVAVEAPATLSQEAPCSEHGIFSLQPISKQRAALVTHCCSPAPRYRGLPKEADGRKEGLQNIYCDLTTKRRCKSLP